MKRLPRIGLIVIAVVAVAATALILAVRRPAAPLSAVAASSRWSCGPIANSTGAEEIVSVPGGMLAALDDRRADPATSRGRVARIDTAGTGADLTDGAPALFHPHGIGIFSDATSSTVFVVNHPQGWLGAESSVETYRLTAAGALTHLATIRIPGADRLNTVAPIGHDAFFVTNEMSAAHGSLAEIFRYVLKRGDGGVYFWRAGKPRKVLDGLTFANGIAVDPRRRLLAVAASVDGTITLARYSEQGRLQDERTVSLGQGPDNIRWVNDGLLVALHPSLRAFQRLATDPAALSPSRIADVDKPLGVAAVTDLMRDDGKTIGGASSALTLPGGTLIGRVFGSAMWCHRIRPT